MGSDMMDVEQLAAYLRRDVREVGKLASRGHLPGHKVGGEWRFARAEINRWLEKQLPEYSDQQLAALEGSTGRNVEKDALLASLLSAASAALLCRAASPFRTPIVPFPPSWGNRCWPMAEPCRASRLERRRAS
jgi:excisionase family DNA binding protein